MNGCALVTAILLYEIGMISKTESKYCQVENSRNKVAYNC